MKPPRPLTLPEARRAVKWFIRIMGMPDWGIEWEISDSPPKWAEEAGSDGKLGMTRIRLSRKHADIWVSNGRCKGEGESALETLFHELLHVQADDCCLSGSDADHAEGMWDRLCVVLAAAYRKGLKF